MPVFTDIKVTLINGEGSLRALASIKVADTFIITGLKVVDGKNGVFISMPSRKDAKGEYHDVAFPVSKEIRSEVSAAVMEAYEKKLYEG